MAMLLSRSSNLLCVAVVLCLTCVPQQWHVRGASSDAGTVTGDDQINCGACKGLFDELDYEISKVPDYMKIDTGSQRMDPKGKMAQNKKSYARSEVHLYEVMETACHEMENYSGFTELGKKVYKRYQNRPEQKTPLKLSNFGWNVDDQARLRFSCDTIMNTLEEDIVDAYMNNKEVPYKKKVCKKYCKKAKMLYALNVWYGKDINGKKLKESETEYVDGMLKASALGDKNKKEKKAHDKRVKAEEKLKKKQEAQEEEEKAKEKAAKNALEGAGADEEVKEEVKVKKAVKLSKQDEAMLKEELKKEGMMHKGEL